MRMRQIYDMPVEKKIAIYRRRSDGKETAKMARKVIRALERRGYQVSYADAEAIMWTPHLVIRHIAERKVYDCSQPLCYSESALIEERAVIAFQLYCRANGRELEQTKKPEPVVGHPEDKNSGNEQKEIA